MDFEVPLKPNHSMTVLMREAGKGDPARAGRQDGSGDLCQGSGGVSGRVPAVCPCR